MLPRRKGLGPFDPNSAAEGKIGAWPGGRLTVVFDGQGPSGFTQATKVPVMLPGPKDRRGSAIARVSSFTSLF